MDTDDHLRRWRFFGATALLSIAFLGCLFLIAEAGRERLRVASEAMQVAMARRILIGQLRQQMTSAVLGCRSYLITGDDDRLEPVRAAGRVVNETSETFVAGYAHEDQRVGEAARRLRYLAGVLIGEMDATIALYQQGERDAALELARVQELRSRTLQRFNSIADAVQNYDSAQMRLTRAEWNREVTQTRLLALVGTIVNILLVAGALVMGTLTLRRYRAAMAQIARRRDELEAESTARAAQLNELYGHLQTVQEQERSRLARGLHDELGGLMLAARMDVSWLQQHWNTSASESVRGRLERVRDVLAQGIDLKRRVIEELRPTLLDNMGLIAALRWQMEETCGRNGIRCTAHFPEVEPSVTPRVAITLFRVLQEALLNVQKHAEARNVDVMLEVGGDHIVLLVSDDGRGILEAELQKPHAHGLAGMRHRVVALGGTLSIGRAPAGGTEVRAIVPSEQPVLAPA